MLDQLGSRPPDANDLVVKLEIDVQRPATDTLGSGNPLSGSSVGCRSQFRLAVAKSGTWMSLITILL